MKRASRGGTIQSLDITQALASALAAHQRGQFQAAASIYQGLLQRHPRNPEANHGLGLIAYQTGRHDLAIKLIETAVDVAPDEASYRTNLGVVYMGAGQAEKAVASYEAALKLDSGVAQTHSNLGVAQLALGRPEAAIASHGRAVQIMPDYGDAHANLGLALMTTGRTEEAIKSYRRAIDINPNHVNAHNNLGLALKAAGQFEEGLASSLEAIRLAPNHAGAHDNAGALYVELGRFEAARESFRHAAEIAPNGTVFRHLGSVLIKLGQFEDAVDILEQAIARDGGDAISHLELGRAYAGLERWAEAVESFQQALALEPESFDAESWLGSALLSIGRLAEARIHYRRALALKPGDLRVHQAMIFMSLYDAHAMPGDVLNAARAYGAGIGDDGAPGGPYANAIEPEKVLRIGLMSGDFYNHSVSHFLETVLAEIDPGKLSLYAYSSSPKSDVVTARLQQSVGNWRDVVHLSDDQLSEKIVADGIDILVDLSGHTGVTRLPVFAKRPAPVQVSWLGYSATTGLKSIDYILSDARVIPASEENQFSETPWRLPDSYLCFTPPRHAPEIGPLPSEKNGFITFGSLNNANKISNLTLACWAGVLNGVPGSRLLLKSRGLDGAVASQAMRERFAAHGIGAERLDLRGYELVVANHLATYNQIDIGLDPFPYAGTTTTAEALWMGVPVLTRAGDRFIAHVGESILHTVRLTDWIARDTPDYIDKATRFAADGPGLAQQRAGLREMVSASPLCDAPRFARNFEAAFRGMWEIWCSAQN